MKIDERIKHLFRRHPATPEEFAARAEACKMCDRKMLAGEDFGGDCVFCMAAAGDTVAIVHVEQLVEEWKADARRNRPPGFIPIGPSD